jgi:hypothetical protein
MNSKIPLTPISPLQPGVEMFQRSRPTSIVPIDADLARRLSVVQELPSPTSLTLPRAASRLIKPRPLSEVTEIYDDDDEDEDEGDNSYEEDRFDDIEELDEDESEFEEDSEGSSAEYMYDLDMVRTAQAFASDCSTNIHRMRSAQVSQPSRHTTKCRPQCRPGEAFSTTLALEDL